MPDTSSGLPRRHFLKTSIAAAGGAALSLGGEARDAARYTRYNAMSDGGKKALASYARGIQEMLKLPADHPQNWFRNAFIHLMDCPHGNWWFYVWHRGYVGYFEQTIRNLSGDKSFAMPYWDWTTFPQISDSMFDSVLTPVDKAFEPYTRDLPTFTSFIKPALTKYWNSLNAAQKAQLDARNYKTLEDMWNDVTGAGDPSNMAFATTANARYLTRANPKLDPDTAKDVSEFVVYSGLLPTDFYNPEVYLSFTSAKTDSHNTPPGRSSFSVLEGMPHNKVHNYIGGYGAHNAPWGNMTNNLSPVDPIFYLHHSNMDRLWDLWTRKQKRLGLPYLPMGKDLDTLSKEPFLFYVDGRGKYVGTSTAADYFSTDRFEYDYEPGFGEKVVQPPSTGLLTKRNAPAIKGAVNGNAASLSIPADAIRSHLAAPLGASLIAEVSLPHPSENSPSREFDVIVGAPANVTQVEPGSPYYAGTIAFFGKMTNMAGMSAETTFAVPLPKAPAAFRSLGVAANAAANAPVSIRVVPSHARGAKAPVLGAVSVIRTL